MDLDKFKQLTTIDFARNKAGDLRQNLEKIMERGKPWPHIPGTISPGFLSPLLISPSGSLNKIGVETSNIQIGSYIYEDWLGQKITDTGLIPIETKERFNKSTSLPKSSNDSTPYSTRDHYLLFNDTSTDYFRHGLQILDNLTPIENGNTNTRLNSFVSTPSEKSDPVIFGFEIIINTENSPLLNGSINDFLNNYKQISEVGSKIPVYEDFKQQFVKFFRTSTSVGIDDTGNMLSKTNTTYANSSSNSDNIFQNGKPAYMNYYLKKIDGLENLSESNTSGTKKYLVDYRKDLIKLEFNEDVSLSVGTLAHLYKLMYWSRPNGKNIIPENLLRFDCDIIISECRNFNRVRKALDSGNLEVLKDNLSRYVYSLKECQLFFNNMPHDSSVNMSESGNPFSSYNIEFDYKYSSVLFEKFMDDGKDGSYMGYNNGAMWKIGNKGTKGNRGSTSSTIENSQPSFFNIGRNRFNQNGVINPNVLVSYNTIDPYTTSTLLDGDTIEEKVENQDEKDKNEKKSGLQNLKDNFKEGLKSSAKRLKDQTIKSVEREIVNLVNTRVNLLSRTINKLGIGFVGGKGIRPPQNVYSPLQDGSIGTGLTNVKDRFFYDVRNNLTDFAGGSLSGFLNGASFKK